MEVFSPACMYCERFIFTGPDDLGYCSVTGDPVAGYDLCFEHFKEEKEEKEEDHYPWY